MATINAKKALIAVSLATGFSLFGDTGLYTVLPTHTSDAGITLANVGILLSVNRFVRLGLNGPIGVLSDRIPRRRVFLPSVFIGALSTAIYALTTGFWPLFAGRLLWGLAWAGLWVSGNAIVLDVASDKDRGRWVGLYHFAFFLGAAAGSIFGGLLTYLLGYHSAMGIGASLTFLSFLVAWILLPETSQKRSLSYRFSASIPQRRPTNEKSDYIAATALLSINRVVVAGVLMATFGLFLKQQFGDTVLVMGREFGIATITGLSLGLSTLVAMVAAPMVGRLSDRFTNRWGVAAGGLSSGILGFGLLSIGSPVAIYLGLPLTLFSSGSNQGISTTIVGDSSEAKKRGSQLGIFFTLGDLGSALGPPIAYALFPHIGLPNVYLLCATLLSILFVLSSWLAYQRR